MNLDHLKQKPVEGRTGKPNTKHHNYGKVPSHNQLLTTQLNWAKMVTIGGRSNLTHALAMAEQTAGKLGDAELQMQLTALRRQAQEFHDYLVAELKSVQKLRASKFNKAATIARSKAAAEKQLLQNRQSGNFWATLG